MQGSCVERIKSSGLMDLILDLALENETEEYNSRRGKPYNEEEKVLTISVYASIISKSFSVTIYYF